MLCGTFLRKGKNPMHVLSQHPAFFGFIFFLGAMSCAVLVYTIGSIGRAAFMKGSNPLGPEAFTAMSEHLAHIFVVTLIIVAAVALRYVDKLDAGPISILSGIAGYVLGNAKGDSSKKKEPKPETQSAQGQIASGPAKTPDDKPSP
jgi:hypothetical protein